MLCPPFRQTGGAGDFAVVNFEGSEGKKHYLQ